MAIYSRWSIGYACRVDQIHALTAVTYALVAAFFTYYLLIDGKGLIDRASEIMPRRVVTDRFLMELDASTQASSESSSSQQQS